MMPIDSSFDTQVLIVGAGPSGLVLACELALRGCAFRLIEQYPQPLIASRGKGLQPRTLEVFEDLGVLPEILKVSGSYPAMRFLQANGTTFERRLNEEVEPTPDVPYPNMLMVPQWRTEAVLRARLGALGGKVDEGVVLKTFDQDDSGVVAALDGAGGEQRIRAQYLVGTDGGRSTVRNVLGVEFPGKVLDGPRYLFGDVTIDGLDREFWHMWPNETRLIGLCPMPHSDTFQLMASIHGDDDPALDTPSVESLIQDRTGRSDLAVRSVGWLSIFTPNLRLAERYRVERVFLVGDAAHVHPPTGAQGLNTSIQDAYNLGWKLALVLTGASPALLDTYEAERRPVAAAMLGLSGALAGKAAGSSSRGRETQQLDLNYRGSVLAPDRGEATEPVAAGDRAPDAPYRLADGTSSRLFELFRGPHSTLLLFGNAPDPIGLERQAVRVQRLGLDPNGPAAIYGVQGDAAVLVRPDNYVGLLDRAPTELSAANWFERCLGTSTVK